MLVPDMAAILEKVLIRMAAAQGAADAEETAHYILDNILRHNLTVKKYSKAYLSQAVRFNLRTERRDAARRRTYCFSSFPPPWLRKLGCDTKSNQEARLTLIDLAAHDKNALNLLTRYAILGADSGVHRVTAMRMRRRLRAWLDKTAGATDP